MNLHRGGRLDEAESGYRECLHDGEVEAAAPLAALLLQQERYGEAVELLEPLARAAPDSAELAVNLSVGLRRSGRAEEALQVGRRACALAPTQLSGWNALGLAALELDRAEEALVAFESGLRLAPAHPALGLHRAHALRRLGRNSDALSAYTQTVQISPDLVDGWRGLASTQAALDQVDEALLSRMRALALAPRNREVAFEHAVALMRASKVVEAILGFEAALQTDPDDAQAWAWLGRARLGQGDLPAARVEFEQARSHDPHDSVIAHFHMAITGTLPDEVESDYIRCLFDDFADRFDHTLVQRLAYGTPARLAHFLRQSNANVATCVLDLGCGTGLMAQ
ncbi:MAG: tetratricopeptide repeat protein, partial [Dokdonella sp.]